MSRSTVIHADVQQAQTDALIEMFELDLSSLGGDVLRFHGHDGGVIRWQGQDYTAWPVRVSGLARTGDASQPAPTLAVGNLAGSISALCQSYGDLVGATIWRRRTFARYLDDAPAADPSAQFPVERWCVEQKSCETSQLVEFTLSSPLDFAGHKLPARQIIAAVCPWTYRGEECGYTGNRYYTRDNQRTDDAGLDQCGHRLSCCRLRHRDAITGECSPLPFGGFLGAGTAGIEIRLP